MPAVVAAGRRVAIDAVADQRDLEQLRLPRVAGAAQERDVVEREVVALALRERAQEVVGAAARLRVTRAVALVELEPVAMLDQRDVVEQPVRPRVLRAPDAVL